MKEMGAREKRRKRGRRRAGTLGSTFLKCNQPGAALLPNVNRGQRLTGCHRGGGGGSIDNRRDEEKK